MFIISNTKDGTSWEIAFTSLEAKQKILELASHEMDDLTPLLSVSTSPIAMAERTQSLTCRKVDKREVLKIIRLLPREYVTSHTLEECKDMVELVTTKRKYT